MNTSNSSISVYASANTTPLHIVITILNVILIFLITFGNSLTISAIIKFRSLHHQSSIMIGALAVADILMGAPYTSLKLLRTHMPYIFTLKIPCIVFMYISHFASIAAVTFLSLLSIERFYAVQFPFHYHAHASVKMAVIFNTAVFVFIAFSMAPFVAGAAMWYEGANCYAPVLYPSYYTRYIVAMAVVPLALGFVSFIRVCVTELRFRRQVYDQSVASFRKQESTRTKLIMTAYVISLSFWVPHIVYYLYATISKADRNIYIFRIVTLLDLASSGVNCFLYAWKNSKFKAAYTNLLCLKRPEDAGNSSTSVTIQHSM